MRMMQMTMLVVMVAVGMEETMEKELWNEEFLGKRLREILSWHISFALKNCTKPVNRA